MPLKTKPIEIFKEIDRLPYSQKSFKYIESLLKTRRDFGIAYDLSEEKLIAYVDASKLQEGVRSVLTQVQIAKLAFPQLKETIDKRLYEKIRPALRAHFFKLSHPDADLDAIIHDKIYLSAHFLTDSYINSHPELPSLNKQDRFKAKASLSLRMVQAMPLPLQYQLYRGSYFDQVNINHKLALSESNLKKFHQPILTVPLPLQEAFSDRELSHFRVQLKNPNADDYEELRHILSDRRLIGSLLTKVHDIKFVNSPSLNQENIVRMLNAWSDLSAKCIDPNELGIHVSRNGNMDTQRKLISKRGLTFYDGNSQEDLEKVVREFCDSNLEYTGKYAPNYLFDCDTKTLSYATEDALSLVSSAHRCLIIENPSKNSQKANDRYTFLVDQIVKRWHEKQKELEQVLNNMSANDPINGTDKMLILMKSRLLPLNKETLTQQGLLIANIIFEIAKFGKSTDPQKRFLASLGDAKDILDKNSLGLSLSKETGHTQQIFGITVILNLNCVNVLAPSRIAYVKGLLPERLSDDEGRWRYANPKLWPSKLKDAFLALPENAPERNQNVTYEH